MLFPINEKIHVYISFEKKIKRRISIYDIVKAPKIELCSIHYESQFEMYSNKEKRLHYPAEAIQMFDN